MHDTRPFSRPPHRNPAPAQQEQAEAAAWRAHAARTGWHGEIPQRRRSLGGNLLRGFSGSLAAGLMVLAVGLVGMQFWAGGQGEPGPGISVVAGHFITAAIALVLQTVAQRRRDVVGTLAAWAVLVVVGGALWTWWWA